MGMEEMNKIITWFWRTRYRLYNRDLYVALRAGRGTNENPVTMSDLQPLLTALKRIG